MSGSGNSVISSGPAAGAAPRLPAIPRLPAGVEAADIPLAQAMPVAEGQPENGAVQFFSPQDYSLGRTLIGAAAGHSSAVGGGRDFGFKFSMDRAVELPSTIHSHPRAVRSGIVASQAGYSADKIDATNEFPAPDDGKNTGDMAVMRMTGTPLVIRTPDGSVREYYRPADGLIHVRTLAGKPWTGIIPTGYVLDPPDGSP